MNYTGCSKSPRQIFSATKNASKILENPQTLYSTCTTRKSYFLILFNCNCYLVTRSNFMHQKGSLFQPFQYIRSQNAYIGTIKLVPFQKHNEIIEQNTVGMLQYAKTFCSRYRNIMTKEQQKSKLVQGNLRRPVNKNKGFLTTSIQSLEDHYEQQNVIYRFCILQSTES